MSTENQDKPPTLRVGVSGFNAFEAKPAAQPERIDWLRLEGLPAFEMYLVETRQAVQHSADFYDAYCRWHAAKGCWPNETPMGELR